MEDTKYIFGCEDSCGDNGIEKPFYDTILPTLKKYYISENDIDKIAFAIMEMCADAYGNGMEVEAHCNSI